MSSLPSIWPETLLYTSLGALSAMPMNASLHLAGFFMPFMQFVNKYDYYATFFEIF